VHVPANTNAFFADSMLLSSQAGNHTNMTARMHTSHQITQSSHSINAIGKV
jgi:hypothetical protein